MGFSLLLRDGADFQQIDRAMEKWGWPMGPAYLLDVVGIDTAVHCETVMAEGFPDRMSKFSGMSTEVMVKANRYGQKNGRGFYDYEADKKGRPIKAVTDKPYELLMPHVAQRREFTEEEIIARTMLPMVTELARCLEDHIVDSPAEADMALIYGIGFPAFRGGVFRWVDSMGVQTICELADKYRDLGKLYEPTEAMRRMAAKGTKYYS